MLKKLRASIQMQFPILFEQSYSLSFLSISVAVGVTALCCTTAYLYLYKPEQVAKIMNFFIPKLTKKESEQQIEGTSEGTVQEALEFKEEIPVLQLSQDIRRLAEVLGKLALKDSSAAEQSKEMVKLSEELRDVTSKRSQLQRAIAQYYDWNVHLSTRLQELTNNNAELTPQVESQQQLVADNMEQFNKIKQQMQSGKDQLKEKDVAYRLLQERLGRRAQEYLQLREAVYAMENQNEKNVQELEELRLISEDIQRRRQDLQKEVDQQEARCQHLKQQKARLDQEMTQLIDTFKSYGQTPEVDVSDYEKVEHVEQRHTE
eukprot:TRINITY_DN2988_c0_g1_i1.p1 TRINITY_DN2988_c0_g1~~TRINITY_DN2988_c0_g1_i1.p1  ORF type:complete len:318 (+),score=37.11 TRINITY_DN2988_c0_g1_i1:21-974(+)